MWFQRRDILNEPINIFYLSILGLLIGYLLSLSLAGRIEGFWRNVRERLSRVPASAILAAGIGTIVALIITVLLNSILEAVPGFTWYWSLMITAILVAASTWFFVTNRELFLNRRIESSYEIKPISPHFAKIVDTSAIIDGRVVEVIESNFMQGHVFIPNFVLLELQSIADSDDPLRRKRGRRGLEVLDRLVQQQKVKTEILADDFPDIAKVDEKLIRLCQQRSADLITTDYNLNRIAALQGVRVLNVNHLANAIRAMFLPGERLNLFLVKQGREAGQALAYLEDGTMVVVEDSAAYVGQTVEVTVTSNIQTNVGRKIFAKLEA
ncbi:MAG: PIN/TRAM domain-containing protein [Deinococcales bacterium]